MSLCKSFWCTTFWDFYFGSRSGASPNDWWWSVSFNKNQNHSFWGITDNSGGLLFELFCLGSSGASANDWWWSVMTQSRLSHHWIVTAFHMECSGGPLEFEPDSSKNI